MHSSRAIADVMKSSRQKESATRVRAFTLLELLTVLGLVAVLSLLVLNSVRTMSQSAQGVSCANNLRQLHSATMAFASDQDGVLPDSKSWQADAAYPGSLAPYLDLSNSLSAQTSPSVMTCPASHQQLRSPRVYCRTYSINIYAAGSVSGVVKPYQRGRLQRSEFPAAQALYLDGPASTSGKLGYYQTSASPSNIGGVAPFIRPHRGSMNVVFFDGHVEMLSKEQLETVLPDATQRFWMGEK